MAVNKVQKSDGTPIMDITDSTVTPDTLVEGYTAYNAAGEKITGGAILGYLETPTVTGVYTYDGTEKTAVISGYDADKLIATGSFSGTNAGTYTIQFTPRSGYRWTDSTSSTRSVNWTIGKATGSITLSKTSVSLSADTTTETITVTRPGTGAISAVSSDTGVATVSVSGDTVTITGLATGTATVTVSVTEDNNYTAPENASVSVTASFLTLKSFSECTEQEAIDMIAAHYANSIDISDYWSVGDTRTIAFAGTSTTSEISTAHPACNMQIRIIGINHDTLATPINGHTKAAITCEFVNSLTNACYIWGVARNGAASPTGGLQDSDVWSNNPRRAWLNSTFKSALPSTLSGAIKTVVKTTKSSHVGSTTETTNDDVFLLSVYEVYKDTDINYQYTTNKIAEGSQYKFYETSSNRIATDYCVGTSNRAYHWLRSPASAYHSSYGYRWCYVYSESDAGSYDGAGIRGLAPAFAI